MKRLLAGITALSLLTMPVAAAEMKTPVLQSGKSTGIISTNTAVRTSTSPPVLTKTSETDAAAVAYEYHPFDPNYSGIYINEFYCEESRVLIVADNGKGYVVSDFTPFTDGSLNCTLRYVSNVQMIRSMKVADDTQRRSDKPAFIMRLSDTAITEDIAARFSATYTAHKDVKLTVTDPTQKNGKNQTLTVKDGAKIVVNHRMNVNYERLNKLQFTPKYNVDFEGLRTESSSGIASAVLYPDDDYKNSSADYCWESLGQICAEIDVSEGSTLPHVPRLSTFWTDTTLLKKFSKDSAYIRDFGGATLESTVQLSIANPFVTFDGEEVIPYNDVVIYEYSNKKLKDVTSKFRHAKNTDGDSAFVASTKKLGVYILSSKKV